MDACSSRRTTSEWLEWILSKDYEKSNQTSSHEQCSHLLAATNDFVRDSQHYEFSSTWSHQRLRSWVPFTNHSKRFDFGSSFLRGSSRSLWSKRIQKHYQKVSIPAKFSVSVVERMVSISVSFTRSMLQVVAASSKCSSWRHMLDSLPKGDTCYLSNG